jgi:hypothetical protein
MPMTATRKDDIACRSRAPGGLAQEMRLPDAWLASEREHRRAHARKALFEHSELSRAPNKERWARGLAGMRAILQECRF